MSSPERSSRSLLWLRQDSLHCAYLSIQVLIPLWLDHQIHDDHDDGGGTPQLALLQQPSLRLLSQQLQMSDRPPKNQALMFTHLNPLRRLMMIYGGETLTQLPHPWLDLHYQHHLLQSCSNDALTLVVLRLGLPSLCLSLKMSIEAIKYNIIITSDVTEDKGSSSSLSSFLSASLTASSSLDRGDSSFE